MIYWLWAIALVAEMVGQLIAYALWTPPTDQGGALFAATPSLIERFGLFVIIVLGEVIVGAVNGMADLDPITADGVVIGLLGLLVAIGLWWIYFDLVSTHGPTPNRTQLWLYLHLPLVIAMAAVGAGVLNTVEHSRVPLPADVRWLLVGALAVAVGTVAVLSRTLEVRRVYPAVDRVAAGMLAGSAVLIAAVGPRTGVPREPSSRWSCSSFSRSRRVSRCGSSARTAPTSRCILDAYLSLRCRGAEFHRSFEEIASVCRRYQSRIDGPVRPTTVIPASHQHRGGDENGC